MRIVFMGSADLSCKAMEALLLDRELEVVLAVTQPSRPKGRNLKVEPCPARAMAEGRGLRVISPVNVNDPDVCREIASVKPDFLAVVAYGLILKRAILQIPLKGCINVHTSLLPAYRGAAPIQCAIANGETLSGVTTMFMNEKMDEGDIIYQEQEVIGPEDTGGSLHDRLAEKGARLLVKTLKDIMSGSAPRMPQDHSKATYAHKLTKQHGRIDWQEPCEVLYNRIRAFNPWPVCWFRTGDALVNGNDRVVRVFRAACSEGAASPGVIVRAASEGIDVGTGSGVLRIMELQMEGGKRMSAEEFLRGHNVSNGKVFC